MVDFGGVLVGRTSPERTMTFTNMGSTSSGALHLALAASPAGFAIVSTTCMGVLAPAASCTASLTFSPTTMASLVTSLALSDGVATSTGTLTGTGTGQSEIAISPTGLDFGHVPPDVTLPKTVTVTNIGNVPTAPLALALGGGEYTLVSDTCTNTSLGDGATCTVGVVFHPTAPGVRSGALTATAGVVGPVTTPLVGSCCAPPPLTLLPSVAAFGTIAVGSASPAQSVTFSNGWSFALGPMTVTLAGASDFVVVSDSCEGQMVPAYGTCAVSVEFRPAAAGSRTASLYVGTGGPTNSTLSGTGQ